MEWNITSCDRNQDPPVAYLNSPYGALLIVPIPQYDQYREALNLPDLVCPPQD